MKLFPILLAGALLVPSSALAGGNSNGNGCRNRCGDTGATTTTDNSGNNRGNTNTHSGNSWRNSNNNNGNSGIIGNRNRVQNGDRTVDRSNTATGGNGYGVGVGVGVGQGGQGGKGGKGGQGGSGGSASASGGSAYSSNSQSQSSSSTSSSNNDGNRQSVNFEGDEREVPIAPLPVTDSIGQIGDIVVPLPNVGLGGFSSTQSNGELDYGVTLGVRVPLGAGSFREAAEAEIQRRNDREQFRLIQEAVWLRDQGLLNEEAHPRHYAALYGG